MTEHDLIKENEITKYILHQLLIGIPARQVAYEAIERDDVDTLKVLINLGLRFNYDDNYIFTALDVHADKCFDLLLESDASKCAKGKMNVDGRIKDVEPLEMACVTGQQDKALKLVEHGAALKTGLGRDILKFWKEYMSEENKCKLIRARQIYEKTYADKTNLDRE